MSLILLFKLLFAHLLSDFVFQTKKICRRKRSSGIARLRYQLLHSLIHSLVAYICVAQWANWIVPLVIFISHLLIDYCKSVFWKEESTLLFLADQFLHFAVIFLLWLFLSGDLDLALSHIGNYLNDLYFWCVFTAYLLVLKPASLLLSLLMKRWTPQESGLSGAGEWIGYLERILILVFIQTSMVEGIGFLLAAKSIFRFGDLKEAKDLKTTEYVLIGSLMSFTLAIIVGFVLLN